MLAVGGECRLPADCPGGQTRLLAPSPRSSKKGSKAGVKAAGWRLLSYKFSGGDTESTHPPPPPRKPHVLNRSPPWRRAGGGRERKRGGFR